MTECVFVCGIFFAGRFFFRALAPGVARWAESVPQPVAPWDASRRLGWIASRAMGAKVSTTASEVSITKGKETEMPYARSAKEFTKLKSVTISKGALRTFPKQLGPDLMTYPSLIDTLVELDLSLNNLDKLPDEICLLVCLRKLRLEENHINRLPENFPALCKLEKCYLNDNDLHELPVDMANMTSLKVRRSSPFPLLLCGIGAPELARGALMIV